LLNGRPLEKNLVKEYTAYVMQDDLFFGNLTVREVLTFAAALRLPKSTSESERIQKVDETITKLGLKKCADIRVGSHGKKGISGGERKRLSVGVELLSDPRLLFLDEPTSGLDSSTACSIINVLKNSTDKCTIICTIHQPSTKIFELFDVLMILAAGNVVYYGPAQEAVDYYAMQNFPCPPLSNPADHFLDVISADPSDPEQIQQAVENAKKLIEAYSTKNGTDVEFTEPKTDDPPHTPAKPGRFVQFAHLYRRAARNYYRNYPFIMTQLIQNIFLGVMIGLVFLDLPLDQTGISRRFSSAFFVSINQGVFAVYAVITAFPAERDIILRERASGTYKTLPYFLAKSLAEIPMQILFPTLFTAIVYPMMGYRDSFYSFAHFWILVELGNMCAISLGFAISAASPTVGLATVITPLIMELGRLFGGFFSQPVKLPGGLIWIQYLSFITYVFTGVAKNEIEPLRFFCTEAQLVGGNCPTTTGEAAITKFNLMDIDIYQCELVLLGMILAFRIVAYVFVLRNK
jgi:ATP-binding cassette subfamily G (WHITE) protein 2